MGNIWLACSLQMLILNHINDLVKALEHFHFQSGHFTVLHWVGLSNKAVNPKIQNSDTDLCESSAYFWTYFKFLATSASLVDFNSRVLRSNYTDPVSGTPGPSFKPSFCLITVVVVGFSCLWIKYDPVYVRNPHHFSTDVPAPHWGSGLFSQCMVEKGGLRLEHKALELWQKAEERELHGRCEWISLIAELEGVVMRQVEKRKKSRCPSAERLLIPLCLKRAGRQQAAEHVSLWT